jgi:hypothetical protein
LHCRLFVRRLQVHNPSSAVTCTTTLLLQAFLNRIRFAEDLPSAMSQTQQGGRVTLPAT